MLTENSSLFRLLYEKEAQHTKLWSSLKKEQQSEEIKGVESIAGKLSKSEEEMMQERVFVFSGKNLFYKKRRKHKQSLVVKASFNLEWALAEFFKIADNPEGESASWDGYKFKIRLRKSSKFSHIFLKSHLDLQLWRNLLSSSGAFFSDFDQKYDIVKFLDESTYGCVNIFP